MYLIYTLTTMDIQALLIYEWNKHSGFSSNHEKIFRLLLMTNYCLLNDLKPENPGFFSLTSESFILVDYYLLGVVEASHTKTYEWKKLSGFSSNHEKIFRLLLKTFQSARTNKGNNPVETLTSLTSDSFTFWWTILSEVL